MEVMIDKEKMREEALEKNDAQEIYEEALGKISKKSREISISLSMNGSLNLGILAEKGYTKVKTLIFGSNSLTDLKNIPDGIERIHCSHNLLTNLKNIPESLVELNLKSNQLQTLDLSTAKQLKKLTVSYNHLEQLESLPESLEILYCDHNCLKKLDLKRNINLKILYCEENPSLRLHNIPDSVIESEYPSHFKHNISSGENTHTSKYHSDEYKEELNQYFRLKNDYEEKLRNLRQTKNKKNKRSEIILPKCIGCEKNVGMEFSNKNRKYQARCGGNPPCDWSLVVNRGEFINREDVIEAYRADVEDMKEKVIQQKMISLYRHMPDDKSSEMFENQMKAYTSANEYLDTLIETHKEYFENEDTLKLIDDKRLEINIALQTVKHELKNQNIREAVEIQQRVIQPLSQSIQRLQYEVMYMIVNINDKHPEKNISILLQESVHPYKLEMNLLE